MNKEINLEEVEDCHNLLLLLATNCHNILQQTLHSTSNFEKVEKVQRLCTDIVQVLEGKNGKGE